MLTSSFVPSTSHLKTIGWGGKFADIHPYVRQRQICSHTALTYPFSAMRRKLSFKLCVGQPVIAEAMRRLDAFAEVPAIPCSDLRYSLEAKVEQAGIMLHAESLDKVQND